MKEFRLQLNNPPHGVYFPGMTVTGTLLVVTDKPKNYRAIQVKILGQAHVHWSQYTNHEDYLNRIIHLWDKDESGGGGQFPVCNCQFPFSLQLVGNNLPASFEGTVGYIRYTIEARIVKDALMKSDTICTSRIKVVNVVDIHHPDLLQPKSMEVQKSLGYLCCAGTIVITVALPRTGYCIHRDRIPVEVTVENGSIREIRQIYIYIIKLVHYSAHNIQSYCIVTVSRPSIGPRRTVVWEPSPIAIPDTPTTSINSRILQVNYSLQVKAAVSWSSNPLRVIPTIDIPLVLGNVPLDPEPCPQLGMNPRYSLPLQPSTPPSAPYRPTSIPFDPFPAPPAELGHPLPYQSSTLPSAPYHHPSIPSDPFPLPSAPYHHPSIPSDPFPLPLPATPPPAYSELSQD